SILAVRKVPCSLLQFQTATNMIHSHFYMHLCDTMRADHRTGASMRAFAFIGIFAILAAIVAAVFFFGGFYNVAANKPDPGVVSWSLEKIRRTSIAGRTHFAAPANLDDAEMVQAGARAYSQRGCACCHGAPGVNSPDIYKGMNPEPPDLKDVA